MNKKIIIFAFLLCTSSAFAAIAHGGSCSGTTACTPSSSVPFQLEIAVAVRAGSTTAPSVPTGWTSVLTKTGTTSSLLVACRVEYSSTATASGTFTNASNVGIVGYTGTGVRSYRDCALATVAIGGNSTNTGSSTTASFSTMSMNNTNNTSWVLAAMFDATSGNVCTSSGTTAVAGATTGYVGVADTNSTVATWAAHTCTTGTSAVWITAAVEIVVPPSNPPVLAQLVNSDGGQGVYPGQTPAANHIRRKIDPTGAGNMEVISLMYTYSATRTVSIVDDKGDTATLASSCNDTGNALTQATYYIQNLTAGATLLTFTFDVTLGSFMENHAQFSGMLTSGNPVDGTPSCATAKTPASLTIGNLADATGTTPTANGDLIYSVVYDENGMANGPPGTLFDWIFPTGYTGLFADNLFGSAAQAEIQTTAALIKPSFTVVQSSYDPFGMQTIAFKTSSGAGTARSTGKILRMTQGMFTSGTGALSQTWEFPCDTGNFIAFVDENNTTTSGANLTANVDTAGNTWTGITPGGLAYPQYWYATNATCNGQGFGNITGTKHGSAGRWTMYELTGALTTSPLDGTGSTGSFTESAATTLGAGVTTATQTVFTLAAAGGIANGNYLLIGAEAVLVTAGGGTTSITVTRAQQGTTALATIASGTSVYESLWTSQPSITTSSANEVIFCAMNQGTGPNWDTLNSTYDFGSYAGQTDNTTTYANGDGMCHAYAPTAGVVALGWYVSNQGQAGNSGYTSALAVKLASTGGVIRHCLWINQR